VQSCLILEVAQHHFISIRTVLQSFFLCKLSKYKNQNDKVLSKIPEHTHRITES